MELDYKRIVVTFLMHLGRTLTALVLWVVWAFSCIT